MFYNFPLATHNARIRLTETEQAWDELHNDALAVLVKKRKRLRFMITRGIDAKTINKFSNN